MITTATKDLITAGLSTVAACQMTGYSRASFYRHHRTAPRARARAPIPQSQRFQPAALCDDERAQILDVLTEDRYVDLSVSQVFYRHWDSGCYIASRSSWYRIARDHAMVGDRRRQRRGPSNKKKPELVATGPGQVWSWDITKLKTPVRGQFWHLYVIVDIYSRYVVGWALHHYEDGTLAEDLIDQAIARHGRPRYLHSDNGAAMISAPVTGLAGLLGVTLSYSRPKVSNDNPFSEALFKTCKYDLNFPEEFTDFEDALAYCQWFFDEYNTNHRHSGIGYHTPENVHYRRTAAVTKIRRAAIDKAWRANPERFTRRPRPPCLPARAHINQPAETDTNLSHTG